MEKIQEQEKSMIQRCNESFESRMKDIRILNELIQLENGEDYPLILEKLKDEYGEPSDYGLSFDFVEPGTFPEQREEYLRYQISWGGPSEEFRIYATGEVEFWFLDWFKGEHINLNPEDTEILFNFLGGSDYKELREMVKK